jgi:hypothetical protein
LSLNGLIFKTLRYGNDVFTDVPGLLLTMWLVIVNIKVIVISSNDDEGGDIGVYSYQTAPDTIFNSELALPQVVKGPTAVYCAFSCTIYQ